MAKYLVKNIDCAMCAAKIEDALNLSEEVTCASLDFSTRLLHVQADDHQRVKDIIGRVDPDVTLERYNPSPDKVPVPETVFQAKSESIKLLFLGILFAGILFLDYYEALQISETAFALVSIAVYLAAGFGIMRRAVNTVMRKDFFDENVLMVIATLGAVSIGAFSEAVAVMVFYRTGEFFQNLAVFRSRRSISSLLEQKPDYANLKTDAGIKKISPGSARAGDVIIVKPGEKIPIDGRVISGKSMVDSSVLTGEPVPERIDSGDDVLAGEINMTGVVTVEVSRPFAESSIAKMLEMVENASARKSATENFITVFARYYTPAMVGLAACLAFLPPLLIPGATFGQWIYRALILLVISCPCALVISIPLGYFGGIGRASRNGILVKGSNYLDALAGVKTVVFDKTGTLTQGVFTVKNVVAKNGYDSDSLLKWAAMAQQHSTHPIAVSITEAYKKSPGKSEAAALDTFNEISGMGVEASFGANTVIIGNSRLMDKENIKYCKCEPGGTTVHMAINGIYAGYILLGDMIRPDSADAIAMLRKNGVKQVVMLTGDNRNAADQVAAKLDLDAYHAGLLPEDKVYVFEKILSENTGGGKVAFVGDGINDAPVIARADVGMAMGGLGSGAAIETADVVLMTDSPAKAAQAVSIGRQTRVVVWQNIVFALSVKAVVIGLGAFGMATMWSAVFADVGTALLAVANSTRLLGRKPDAAMSEGAVFSGEKPKERDPFLVQAY